MLEHTKYAHFTVPHSGTRFVNHAVEQALGKQAWQCGSPAAYNRMKDREEPENQEFLFCHIGQRFQEWIDECIERPNIKSWVTVRSPIHTWGTHFGHLYKGWPEYDIRATYEKLGQLRSQYEALLEVAPQVGYVHRVDIDDLSRLGDYLGLELEEHEKTFSNPTPMKVALLERDIEAIEKLCEGTDFWKAFHDYITPDFKDFFEELGYDIWWYNG